jgi:heme exporter protein C
MTAALANPHRFMAFSRWAAPALGIVAAGLIGVGLWLGLTAPPDYQQGESVRIMFVHVPAAWVAMLSYACLGGASFFALIFRHALADAAARAAAPLGAAFTLAALVTGSLWGRPMWGTWWVWDARLTSELVLLLMYLGLIALWQAVEDPGRAARIVAILTLVGSINIPIIKFSVDWWNTLHQGESIFRAGGPTIDGSMLRALFAMMGAMTLLYIVLLLLAMRNEILRRRVRTLEAIAAGAAG